MGVDSARAQSRLSANEARVGFRLAAFFVLSLTEIVSISYLFYFPVELGDWSNPAAYVRRLAHVFELSVLAFILLLWPRREEFAGLLLRIPVSRLALVTPVAANLIVFALATLATSFFTAYASAAAHPPWGMFAAYCLVLAATAVSLALIAAPFRIWIDLPRSFPIETVLAIFAAVFVQLASELSREGWHSLSTATLNVAALVLSPFEDEIFVDAEHKVLGVGGFRALILPECSGYEGIGLVGAFLSVYLWVFRALLRFPAALLIVPVAVMGIWLLNAVRIAALVSIGAHWSPEVAANGFHSRAGWIAFVLVAVATMVAARHTPFLQKQSALRTSAPVNARSALLLPFIGLMATTIAIDAAAPHGHVLYGLKVVVVGTVLYYFRDVYRALQPASLVSVATGVVLGIVWVASESDPATGDALGAWLVAIPPWIATAWIACRLVGAVAVVPLAEELAFRGYLHAAIASRGLDALPTTCRFDWLALLGTSLAFGILHQRWLAGMIAGAVFAALMYRTRRLSDAIAGHMACNAVVAFWAVSTGRWSLL